ncbi:hypothetical protein ACP70R_037729 [Stipagrostis hirtigluma subsp. patula]
MRDHFFCPGLSGCVMSSYSSLLSLSPHDRVLGGEFAVDGGGDADDMSSYLTFDADAGDEYYPIHSGRPGPAPLLEPLQADADYSGKAGSSGGDVDASVLSQATLAKHDRRNNEGSTSGDGARGPVKSKSVKIAFKTRSDVDVLDDGYRWRKYGKKMVKNSPNPRNYYRCSSEGCRVKKRVERQQDDARFVITTYEGVHDHPAAPPPSPVFGSASC